eukprot:9980503-Ditylum_brightwellii.AAC.1
MKYVAAAVGSDGSFEASVTVATLGHKLTVASEVFKVSLIIGDANAARSVLWDLGTATVYFKEGSSGYMFDRFLPKAFQRMHRVQSDIEHMFRVRPRWRPPDMPWVSHFAALLFQEADKRPPAIVTTLFLCATAAPLA